MFLKKNEDKRLRKGHLWVFSNEIDTNKSPLNSFKPGERVQIFDSSSKSCGIAYINPNALICARIISRKTNVELTIDFFKKSIKTALELRENFFSNPFYRLFFAESDGIPGLIIDRFEKSFSIQISTVGIELNKQNLIQAIDELFEPELLVLKNDIAARDIEELTKVNQVIIGDMNKTDVQLIENESLFIVNLLQGQKTGWFYDHRLNRQLLNRQCQDRSVLDLFSYTGGWGIQAAVAGATNVKCIDRSEYAIDSAKHNAEINHVSNKVEFEVSDIFDFLKTERSQKKKYDIVILDPPALIKRKKDFKAGFEAYRRLNFLALQVLNKGGVLVSASCSSHLSKLNLHELIRQNARHIDRHISFFAVTGHAPDHPIHPAIPETDYLKTIFCSVNSSL